MVRPADGKFPDPPTREQYEEKRLTPDVEVLKSDATKYLTVTTAITTAAEYASSADTLKAGKAFVERVDLAFQPLIDSIQESLKKTKSLRDSITTPVKDHRRMVEAARYQFELQQAAAHAKANAEMLELAKQVQESDQEALAAMGLDDMAGASFMPPPLPAPIQKSLGISVRKGWSAEVTDEAELFLAVASGRAPRNCFMVNQVFLNSMAKAAKTTLAIPGVKAVFKKITSVRG